jgi:hypothetical protein
MRYESHCFLYSVVRKEVEPYLEFRNRSHGMYIFKLFRHGSMCDIAGFKPRNVTSVLIMALT